MEELNELLTTQCCIFVFEVRDINIKKGVTAPYIPFSKCLECKDVLKVNGKVVTELGTKVTPGVDKVLVDNKPVAQEEELVYILMNKPAGYVTTVKDTHERRTVMDLLTGVPYRVFPVGRLDFETEGLLLLTNDGEFAYRMTHPKFKIKN